VYKHTLSNGIEQAKKEELLFIRARSAPVRGYLPRRRACGDAEGRADEERYRVLSRKGPSDLPACCPKG